MNIDKRVILFRPIFTTKQEKKIKDTKITIASLRSVLIDPQRNLDLVKKACIQAKEEGARLLFLPELMLTGHGGHQRMIENGEVVPEGPLSQAVLKLSKETRLCICTGIAEISDENAYNSQMVVDRGRYLGLQRKIYLSGDESQYFEPGEEVEVFDIGEIRFGITICFDNHFPELALMHSLHNVDLILSPHAARTGPWPETITKAFRRKMIQQQQDRWEKMYRGRAYFHNLFILANNAVGPSTEDLEDVTANHAGTVFGVDPSGEVILRTSVNDFVDEIVTVELKAEHRKSKHKPSKSRRLSTVKKLFENL